MLAPAPPEGEEVEAGGELLDEELLDDPDLPAAGAAAPVVAAGAATGPWPLDPDTVTERKSMRALWAAACSW